MADPDRLQRERDFYRRLLELGRRGQLEELLREALNLVVEITSSEQGYVELYDDDDTTGAPLTWMASGYSSAEIDGIRRAVSRGIVAESLATGQTISTPAALLDPRFNQRESVLASKIGSVLCVPIGEDPPRGVLYLQRGAEYGAYDGDETSNAELFARHLAPLVDRFVDRRRMRGAADPLRELRAKLNLNGVVGRSPALAAALQQVALVAPLDVNVLITGESGTGKSQLANLIHENSGRAHRPFLELNCAALPEGLIESELFGAMQGAHSTATRPLEGKVAAAEGGTLLLDEIGEMPASAQAKLLQLLQSKQYFPLGASRPVQADVRILAATNSDLQEAVATKRFREDLFYRLQILPIRLPSLRERREDIEELAEYFCGTSCERHRLPRIELSRDAIRAVEVMEWPGNIRQLANAIEAAVIRACGTGATQVGRDHLVGESSEANSSEPLTFQEATRRFQSNFLSDVLAETSWNVSEAARRMGVARSHIYGLIRAFGLKRRTR